MKLLVFLSCLLAFARCDDDSSSDEGSGEAASTDASQFAGVYSFVYYYNQDKNATSTTQLPCKNSTSFQLTIPEESSGGDVTRDLGSSDADPIYKTTQSSWTIMEVGKGNGFNILKMSLYYNDDTDMIVCWALKKSGHNIIANVNPRNLTECPVKYFPISDTCTLSRATLVGTCMSGACNGTSTSTTQGSSATAPTYLLPLLPLSLLLI